MRWIALLLVLICALGQSAHAEDWKRPQIFLIVCDGLTMDDLHLGDNTNPHLANLAEKGTLGLMNCAVAEPKSDIAAMLALATGQQVRAQASDEHAANDWEKAPGEKVSAAESYRLRLGLPVPGPDAFDPRYSVKHLGLRELRQRGLDTARLGAVLGGAVPPVTTRVIGNADTAGWRRRGALLTLNRNGVGAGVVALRSYDPALPFGLTDNPPSLVQYALWSRADLVVIQMGDGARAETARPHLSDAAYVDAHDRAMRLLNMLVFLLMEKLQGTRSNILIVSPRPPAADAAHPTTWNRLTPVIGYGPAFPPGTFSSASTRTPSLISNMDIAPTILSLYHLPPAPTMVGRPARVVPDSETGLQRAESIARVSRLDYVAWMNAAGLAPILAVLGASCLVAAVAGLVALRVGGRRAAALFATCMVAAMNLPAAQLFAPILIPPTLTEYGLRIAAWMAALTIVAYAAARLFRVSPPVTACALNVVAVLADLVTGQHLLKDALISNYYLPGFRYYGIGNDYLGLILGLAIAGAFSLLDDRQQAKFSVQPGTERDPTILIASLVPPSRPVDPLVFGTSTALKSKVQPPVTTQQSPGNRDRAKAGAIPTLLIVVYWAAIALILGWPAWGANSGSVIVSCVAFGVGWRVLRGRGIWWAAPLFCLVGIGLTFGLAYLDAKLHGAQSAHAGAALQAAGSGRGVRYLWTIIQRKVLLNISLLAAPWTWVAASAFAGTLLLAPILAEAEISETQRRRVWLARSLWAVAAAVIASLLFKDSGVVTACYLVASVILVGLYYLLTPAPNAT